MKPTGASVNGIFQPITSTADSHVGGGGGGVTHETLKLKHKLHELGTGVNLPLS